MCQAFHEKSRSAEYAVKEGLEGLEGWGWGAGRKTVSSI